MKVLIQIVICGTLLLGGAVAQHRGGGGGGGGFHGSIGGGSRVGGGGFVGGGSAFRGGVGFGRGIGYGGYYGGCCYGGYGYGWGFGLGLGYGYPYYSGIDYPYGYGYYPDTYAYPAYQTQAYPAYNPSSNVTVVYPPSQQAAPSYGGATPMMREYDQYGQQIPPSGQMAPTGGDASSPIYLIAMKNHNIVAASSYSVTGNTLHYFTLEHAEQQVALDAVDRDLTQRLNQERHVPIQFQQHP